MAEVAGPLEGVEAVLPMRTTFYGAQEIFVRAPGRTRVGFTERSGEGDAQ